ncbi:UDP-glycosyltransferase 1 [Linum perenne]
MAQGHMVPMIDIAKLLAQRSVHVSVVTTPVNAARFNSQIRRLTSLKIDIFELNFPCSEAGLPEGCESFDLLPSQDLAISFFSAAAMMENQAQTLLAELSPPPSCIVSDISLPYTSNLAAKFGIPRISFHGFSCMCLLSVRMICLHADEIEEDVGSDSDYFVLPGFPDDQIKFTKLQLPMPVTKETKGTGAQMLKADSEAYGVIMNSFQELEDKYIAELKKGKVGNGRIWCVGPVSLTNSDELDKLQRGGGGGAGREIVDWLDSKDPNSVIYVCFGSICNLKFEQLTELALGLEASNRKFVWAVRVKSDQNYVDFNNWIVESGFEDRISERGLLIRGWAPQMLILSHPAVGGFMTHCGWNSTIEGISAGIPMVTWPLFGDQFCNQKLVIEELRVGVEVGVKRPMMENWKEVTIDVVPKEDVAKAVETVMDGGEQGEERRRRAIEVAKMAKRAVENGGSSQENITELIEDIKKYLMAQGHMIPMFDIAKLLATRDVHVTIITTPLNAARFVTLLHRANDNLRLPINLVQLRFPCKEAGLPENCENFDMLPSLESIAGIFKAASLMEPEVESLFEKLVPRPTCIVSDFCLPYTNNIAKKFNVPRISFHGFSCFCLACVRCVKLYAEEVDRSVSSDYDYFVLPGIPGGIRFTKIQLPLRATDKDKNTGTADEISKADSDAYGVIVNSFEELEAEYLELFKESKQGKVWCVGPVSLTNRNDLDKLQRGNNNVTSNYLDECFNWLENMDPGSVLYVCLGSICNLSSLQLKELALGLEASSKPFIWAIRETEATKDLYRWMEDDGFEGSVSGRGMLIRGWAPQVTILSHPAVGGFLTHCGWNSSLEGISAGVPLVTWPLFGDQFSNEKLIVEVVKIGVRVGVERPTYFEGKEESGVMVAREQVERAVRLAMDVGEEGEERRKRAKELAEMARRAVDTGGSSWRNIGMLIDDVGQWHQQRMEKLEGDSLER